jgi:Protein of unknown function (DUF3631)
MALQSLNRIAEILGGRVSGNEVIAPGPGHSAADASMSIKVDAAAPDGFVVHSFAGDDDIACKDYVRKKLGIERERPRKANGGAKPFSPTVARYTYRAADGTPYLQVQRTAAKDFYQHHWDGEKWLKGAPDGPKIPYCLPELLAAPSTAPIYICEGEKDCDNLAKLGFVATCNSEGADTGTGKKWTPDLNQYFKDRAVYVLADNDDKGRKHAQHVARNLDSVAASVRVVELPDLPAKGDVSDWLKSDTAGVKLAQLCQAAPLWAEAHRPIEAETDTDAEIARLAALTPVQYERERKAAAERLDIRAAILDKLVQAERPESDSKQGSAISFPEPELWPERIEGAHLLDSIADAIRRHVVMSNHARDTAALWAVHPYLLDCFLVSPRLAITSPTKQCGKTTLLDVLARLVLKPLPSANVSTSVVFRVVQGHRPTLLIDEADTFIRENDELRGVLNSGHRQGGSVVRNVGDEHEPRAFSTYSACAIALIGRLPDTLHDRSLTIALKRRMPSETVAPFRSDRADYLDALAGQAARWAQDHAEQIRIADPDMPEGVFNREADNWRPLLAIADAAGGDWPKRARQAVRQAHADAEDDSRVAMLLGDIKAIFTDRNMDRLSSADVVIDLAAILGRPWADYKNGKPITQNQLARILKPLGIAPDNVRIGDKVPKGYQLAQFADAFARYLAPEGGIEPLQRYKCDEQRTYGTFQSATRPNDVAVQKCEKSNNDGLCSGVAVQKGGEGRVCDQCGESERPDDPIQECWVAGEQHWLHRGCQRDWMGTA